MVYPTACTAAPAATEIALPPAADNPDFAFTCKILPQTLLRLRPPVKARWLVSVCTLTQSNVKSFGIAAGSAWPASTQNNCWITSKSGYRVMKQAGRGFSMIELLIGVAVLGILLALGASSFKSGSVTLRIELRLRPYRTASTAAARRCGEMPWFASKLGNDLTAGCALTLTTSNWIVGSCQSSGCL
ncbi:MAG: type II secretion system protein [Propionivibrio sp.]|nr:type II secretion system protein [Propionivibrio sp.]